MCVCVCVCGWVGGWVWVCECGCGCGCVCMCVCVCVCMCVFVCMCMCVHMCVRIMCVCMCMCVYVHQTHCKTQQCPSCNNLEGLEYDDSQTVSPHIHDNHRLQLCQNLLIHICTHGIGQITHNVCSVKPLYIKPNTLGTKAIISSI